MTIAIKKMDAERRRVTVGRNILTVASGKGGVGKTWVAITLAHALSQMDRRILLFDGDLGLANIDIQLGLMPQYDLGGVLSGQIAMDKAITAHVGFDIIAGRSGTGSLASLPPRRIEQLRDSLFALSERYDHALVDLGAGLDEPVRLLTPEAGIGLVVTTDEPTALTDAYAYIKVMHSLRPHVDLRIIINKAAGHPDGERTYHTLLRACETFLRISPPLCGVIRRDPHVADCIRRQTPLLTRFPNTEAAVDVEALAKKLFQKR